MTDQDYHAINDEYKLLQRKEVAPNMSRHNHIESESPIIKESISKSDETLKKLWIVSGICLVFMIIEVIGGYLANSIAIMSDAAHLLSDFLGFIISIVSIYISRKGANHSMSYGYHRAEVIGALVSVNLIWGLTIWLLYEAMLRIIHGNDVNGLIMLITAVIGFVFNVVMGVVLAYQGIDHNLHHHHDHDHDDHGHSHGHSKKKNSVSKLAALNEKQKSISFVNSKNEENHYDNDLNHSHNHDHSHNHSHNHDHSHNHSHNHDHLDVNHNSHGHSHENVNLRAALIHVIGDAIQNLGVVIAGGLIYFYPNLTIADPICTMIFSIIVVFTTIRILKDCIAVLMEGSPVEFDMHTLEEDLLNIKGVTEIHDLHVWSLSVGKLSLSCHLISKIPQVSLNKARKLIRNKYNIAHSTIQVELESEKESQDCAHDLHDEIGGNKKN